MAEDPGIGYKVKAAITGLKGTCAAGHEVGHTVDISCYHTGGLCRFCCHHIFSDLSPFQFGGSIPWWKGDVIELSCPDTYSLLTLQLERKPRA